MRRLIWIGVIVVALAVHTVVTDRETKSAEERRGGEVVKLDGGDLFVKDEGDRDDPVVVLLHGYTASQRWWDRLTPHLVRRGLRVIRPDLLGHGASAMPRDGYGPGEQARRVAALLRKLDVRRAAVIGHSMGGTIASALVEQRPRLVRRVGVIGAAPRDGFVELPLTARIGTWPVVGQLSRRIAPDPLIRAGLASAFADDVEVPDAFVDDLDRMTYTAYDESSSASQDFLEERANSARIERADVPLLVIFGMADEIVDPEAADAWAEDVGRARVVKLRGVGHSPHWEQPRQVADHILDFAR